ncbi:MAG: hypothetical protein EZS28_051855, partial [Streblomastix strix]
GSSFEVTKFVRLTSSSASGVAGSRSWEWGNEWVVEKVKQPRHPRLVAPPPPSFPDIHPFIIPPIPAINVPNSPSPPPRSPCTIARTPSPGSLESDDPPQNVTRPRIQHIQHFHMTRVV